MTGNRSLSCAHLFFTLLAGCWLAFSPVAAWGQGESIGPIEIVVERPQDIGLEGCVRVGTWTPMRLVIKNHTRDIRKVAVDWIMPDIDGDIILSRRGSEQQPVVLSPSGARPVFLYAVPPVNSEPKKGWRVRVVDLDSEEVVAARAVAPLTVIGPDAVVIGLTGGGPFGLDRYRDPYTRHESVQLCRGLVPTMLPDRWHGLSLIDALIWTRFGGAPTNPQVPMNAVKEWVRRGGHLIVTLSAADEAWADPALASFVPNVEFKEVRRVEVPAMLQARRPDKFTNVSFSARTFEPNPPTAEDDRDVSVWLRAPVMKSDGAASINNDNADASASAEPNDAIVGVTGQYGLGAVTLIGIDLTDKLFTVNDPNSEFDEILRNQGIRELWKQVLHYRGAFDLDVTEEIENRRMADLGSRSKEPLGRFIPSKISMKKTAGATMLIAFVFFVLYWLAGGPAMFAFLRSKGWSHHSWLAFGLVVLLFSGLMWTVAVLMRPSLTQVEHFSVIDIDATSNEARVQSWVSLYVPQHGEAALSVATAKGRPNQNTVSSPGFAGVDAAPFPYSQRYIVDAAEPHGVDALPVRSTAKQFRIHYQEPIAGSELEGAWSPPSGELKLVNGWPTGELTHRLPSKLTNVLLVYCPGDGDMPRAWRYVKTTQNQRATPIDWEPGVAMELGNPNIFAPQLVSDRTAVVQRDRNNQITKNGWEGRTFSNEGFLGSNFGEVYKKTNVQDGMGDEQYKLPPPNKLVSIIEMLSFFSYMPPPDFAKDNDLLSFPVHLTREACSRLDLSHLTNLRRLIIIGHLESDSPLPVPLTVDGDEVNASGWTTVRFILPVKE